MRRMHLTKRGYRRTLPSGDRIDNLADCTSAAVQPADGCRASPGGRHANLKVNLFGAERSRCSASRWHITVVRSRLPCCYDLGPAMANLTQRSWIGYNRHSGGAQTSDLLGISGRGLGSVDPPPTQWRRSP